MQIFYTFFLMELLQFLQYFVLGDCSNWLNRVTTVVSSSGNNNSERMERERARAVAEGSGRCCKWEAA